MTEPDYVPGDVSAAGPEADAEFDVEVDPEVIAELDDEVDVPLEADKSDFYEQHEVVEIDPDDFR